MNIYLLTFVQLPPMAKSILVFPVVALSTFLAGCVGTGPNTEQGAVAGGVLGAVAGAVIGHNSRNGDAVGGAILGAAGGAVAGGVLGNSIDHERGTLYGPPSRDPYGSPDDPVYRANRGQAVIAPATPPPAPQDPMPPSPAPNAVWVAGHWLYDGRSYTWVAGRWEIPPPMATVYVPAHNEIRDGQRVYVPGHWR